MAKKEKFGKNQFILMFFAFSFGMILSNLLAQHREQNPTEGTAALFIYRGEDKGLEDVSSDLKAKIEVIDSERRKLIELAAIEMHVHYYAHKNDLSLEEASRVVLPISDIDPQSVSDFYNKNQLVFNKPFFEVKKAIEARYRAEAIEKAKYQLLDSLQKSGDLAFKPN